MNKAVTEGLILMPPPFAEGLSVWSSGDGTPGSASYDGAPNAAYVPSDPDFEGCLELLKTSSTQKLRWKGNTPVINGLYLRVTARVKAMSGALPSVRIAGFAATAGDAPVPGAVVSGPSTTLTTYGQVVEVSAIIATAILTVCMFVAGEIGLVDLIASGYRFLAWLFLAVFVVPLITIGTWRLLRGPAVPPMETSS